MTCGKRRNLVRESGRQDKNVKKIMMGMTATAMLLIGLIWSVGIDAYAAFPTFVRTREYRSDMYAVEISSGDEEPFPVFDISTEEDDLATPTDITDFTSQPIPDEVMHVAVDDEIEIEPDSDAKVITSYYMEPAAEEPEEPEEQPIPDDAMMITPEILEPEELNTPVNDISS